MNLLFNKIKKLFNDSICYCPDCQTEFADEDLYNLHFKNSCKHLLNGDVQTYENNKWVAAIPLPYYGTKYDWEHYK